MDILFRDIEGDRLAWAAFMENNREIGQNLVLGDNIFFTACPCCLERLGKTRVGYSV
jgi:hypothetical protein